MSNFIKFNKMKTKIQFAVFALLTVIAFAFACISLDFAMDKNSNAFAVAYIFGCIVSACCFFEASALYKECDFKVSNDSCLCDNVGTPVQHSRSITVWHTLHDMRNASYILEEAFRDVHLYEPAVKQAIEQYEAAELAYIHALNTTGMKEEITDYDKWLVNVERTRFAMYASVPAMKQFVKKYDCGLWVGYLDNKELMNAIIK